MRDIIDFLERLGQDAQLRHAGCGELRAALDSAGVDQGAAATILAGDERGLAARLAVDRDFCCLIWAPQREEEEEEEVPAKDAPDDAPTSQIAAERRAA